jgi:hypothetical protein
MMGGSIKMTVQADGTVDGQFYNYLQSYIYRIKGRVDASGQLNATAECYQYRESICWKEVKSCTLRGTLKPGVSGPSGSGTMSCGPSTGTASCTGSWGRGAGGGTMPPPSETKPGGQGVDSKALRDEYYKKCKAMRDAYAKRNCTPIYSDCANVPRGCYGYVINGALPDGKSQARVGCGRGVVDSYISCLRNCNEQLLAKKLNMFSIEGCGTSCKDKAVAATKACDASNQ